MSRSEHPVSELWKGRRPVTRKQVASAALLAITGYLGNALALHLGYNVDFLLGSIFSLMAVRLLGIRLGVAVALIAACQTWLAWNHPYAVIILTAEAVWVGVALRSGRRNLLLLDACYWLVVGMPLVFLYYGGVMRVGLSATMLMALKQGVNGVANALLATLLLNHILPRRWLPEAEAGPPPYADMVFTLAAACMMLPALALMLIRFRGPGRPVSDSAALRAGRAFTRDPGTDRA